MPGTHTGRHGRLGSMTSPTHTPQCRLPSLVHFFLKEDGTEKAGLPIFYGKISMYAGKNEKNTNIFSSCKRFEELQGVGVER